MDRRAGWWAAAGFALAGAGFLFAGILVLGYGFSSFGLAFLLIALGLVVAGVGCAAPLPAGAWVLGAGLGLSSVSLLWVTLNAGDEWDYNLANATIGIALAAAAVGAWLWSQRGGSVPSVLRWAMPVAAVGTAAYIPIELLKDVTDYLVGDVLSLAGFAAAAAAFWKRPPDPAPRLDRRQ